MQDDQLPDSVIALEEKVASVWPKLPRRLQDCAAFVMRQGDQMAFLTVAQASQQAGIPASAFIRFSQALGLAGYSALQQIYRDRALQSRPSYTSRLAELRDRGSDAPQGLLHEFGVASQDAIERLLLQLDGDNHLEEASRLLAASQSVHIVGFRRAFTVSSYLAYLLGQFNLRVILHDRVGELDVSGPFRTDEVLVGISFEPYSQETVQLGERAKAEGASVLAITDSPLSPLRSIADLTLDVAEAEVGSFRTYSATLCLVAVLAISVGARLGGEPYISR